MKRMFPVNKFNSIKTPFYYYDTELLNKTLDAVNAETSRHTNYHVHYAIKANANTNVLKTISQHGFGADCVSGGEIQAAIDAGFPASKIVYAGVGKSDWEINLGLDNNIFCFNVESVAELEVINTLAAIRKKTARIAFRINPDIGAHTHANITTGLAENKFGIAMADMENAIRQARTMDNINVIGLHFHIGSQILDMKDFEALCYRINEILSRLEQQNIHMPNINVGGGLGINYEDPDEESIPDFKTYFGTYAQHLSIHPGQHLHFELGSGHRSTMWDTHNTPALCQRRHQ